MGRAAHSCVAQSKWLSECVPSSVGQDGGEMYLRKKDALPEHLGDELAALADHQQTTTWTRPLRSGGMVVLSIAVSLLVLQVVLGFGAQVWRAQRRGRMV